MTGIPIGIETVNWPEDVAAIYAEIAEEDRRLAQLMWSGIKETWPEEESGMATVETRLMTAEEFYEWANRPENRGRVCELERGRIVEMSRPGKLHGLICANVAGILRNYVIQRKKGYVCSNDTGVIVGRNPDTVRGPDVLLFEDAESVEQVEEKYGETPPVLAVEVLSPNDTYGKVRQRVLELFAFGTRLIWVLDPDAGYVIVHYPGGQDRVAQQSQELTGNEILPDFRCRVAEFFTLPGASM